MEIRGRDSECTVRRLRKHQAIPITPMCGPRRFAVKPLDWSVVTGALAKVNTQSDLDAAYAGDTQFFTSELLDATGLGFDDASIIETRLMPPKLVEGKVFRRESGFPLAGPDAFI